MEPNHGGTILHLIIHSPFAGYVVRIVGPRPRVRFWVSFLWVKVNSQALTCANRIG